MSKNFIENILGSGDEEQTGQDELEQEAVELDYYRPYLCRVRPVLALVLIEKSGTMHGFHYIGIRHSKFEIEDGKEFLSFVADGCAVVMEGKNLRPIFAAMQRFVLAEAREHDGKPVKDSTTVINRLAVSAPHERPDVQPRQKPQLVK